MKILDDGAQRPKFKHSTVSLSVSKSNFKIQDTCGGISEDDAKKTIFRFGIPLGASSTPGLSVYGIGMKRAFFKLGGNITVESATDEDWFVMDIDVNQWNMKGDDDWDFELKASGKAGDRVPSKPRAGTTQIVIKDLRDDVSRRFGQTSFVKELVDRVAAAYSLFLTAGLNIQINDERVQSKLPTVASLGTELKPARRLLKVGGVEVLVIVGVTPRDDRTPRGWYVFCNGRMVLGPDRSRLTGWGELLPQWHTKYSHFVGYVYFRSNDVRLLPWTTTKQGVVFDSGVYQTALAEMHVQARPVISFLNAMYPGEPEPEGVVERELLDKAHYVPIDKLRRADTPFQYDLNKRKNLAKELVRIQYSKPRKDVERIRGHLKRRSMSASKIGEYTFDYYIKQECD